MLVYAGTHSTTHSSLSFPEKIIMLEKLRKNAFWTALLVWVLYLFWFLAPFFIAKIKGVDLTGGEPVLNETANMAAQLSNQIWLVVGLTAIVALLAWWRQVGFAPHIKDSIKFILPPLLVTAVYFGVGWYLRPADSTSNIFGANTFKQTVQFLLATFMVGYTEELMFRGILQYGLIARFKPVLGVILTAIIFGSMHFENMLLGQGFGETASQVVHAASDGFMYSALRLISGSLWPVMILHGLWDLSVSMAHTQMAAQGGAIAKALTDVKVANTVNISPMQFLPGLLYGIFVLWRWVVRNKKGDQTTM